MDALLAGAGGPNWADFGCGYPFDSIPAERSRVPVVLCGRAWSWRMVCSGLLIVVWYTTLGRYRHLAGDREMLEYFDTDNESVSLGKVPIHVLHERELLHRGVRIHVLDQRGRVLMLRRGAGLVTCPNAWTLVGEHRRPGESVLDACLRGAREELGAPKALSAADLGLKEIAHRTSIRIVRHSNACAGYGDRRGERTMLDGCALIYNGSWALHLDEEVAGTRWVAPETLSAETAARPHDFCCEQLAHTFSPSVYAARNWLVDHAGLPWKAVHKG